MQTADNNGIPITVELQDNFAYLPIGLIVVIVILLAILAYFIFRTIQKNKNKPEEVVQVAQPPVNRLLVLKEKYINMLIDIGNRHNNEELSGRHAYQELSKVIRHFVYDVTGIKVQNYTLDEIRYVNIPILYYLISECYAPEFDTISEGNVYETINKARKVIEEWN